MNPIKNLVSTITSHLPGKSTEKARSVNTYTGEVLHEYDYITEEQISQKIEESWNSYKRYKKTSIEERAKRFRKLADILEKDTDRFARIITLEMGKPITESREEVKVNIEECRYLADNAQKFTEPQLVGTDAKKSYVSFDPIGVVYHITPFNFPFRLLFRGTLSALLMGNTVINKNPSNCPQVGIVSEEAFREAGWDDGEFVNIIISSSQSELIIKDPHVRLISFTGSTEGGKKIGELAGKYCKKSILELGGSDPFVVLKDADLDKVVEQGFKGRLLNGGQVCTAAKRFIIDEQIYDDFKNKLLEKVAAVKMGDPMDEKTTLGPLAKKSGLESVMDQVERARQSGSTLLYGGEKPRESHLLNSTFFMPSVFEVNEESPLFKEETFGPIFALIKFKDEHEALRIANNTKYGLGSAIFSKDEQRAQEMAKEIEAGAVYINHYADWDVKMPEGGFKESGYGRDGGLHGTHEFANIKTIWIGK